MKSYTEFTQNEEPEKELKDMEWTIFVFPEDGIYHCKKHSGSKITGIKGRLFPRCNYCNGDVDNGRRILGDMEPITVWKWERDLTDEERDSALNESYASEEE